MAGSSLQRDERNAALLLIGAAALAVGLENSPLAAAFHSVLDMRFGPVLPRFGILSLHQWVADGLMAVFFLLVGLEVKREWYDGRLASPAARRLPFLAAAAGMAVPALLYLAMVGFDPALDRGWAIPAATDIAFAIGILALLGPRANPAIKILLVTIAIVDDIGAVAIIAIAYTDTLDGTAIAAGLGLLAAMAAMNQFGVRTLWPYVFGFALLWLATLASGIHPTVAGVLAALTVPLGLNEARSPLETLEHRLHPWVMFGVMPLFGLASAGVRIDGLDALASPIALAVFLGLFVGKQVGVFGALWLADRAGVAPRPATTGWAELYGAALLCGVGFTMSLFIGNLAFPADPAAVGAAKLGTLAGSLLSAVAGYCVLRLAGSSQAAAADREDADEIFGGDAGPPARR